LSDRPIIASLFASAGATERGRQKIVLRRQLADLGVEFLHVRPGGFAPLRRRGEHVAGPLLELALPLGDLVGMDFKLFRQLRQGLVALERRQGHLGLEGRRVVSSRSFHLCSPVSAQRRAGDWNRNVT
jgi:hypothetical protein